MMFSSPDTMPRTPNDPTTDLTQLQNSIAALTTAFTEFRTTQDTRHDSYLSTFQNLQNQNPSHQLHL